MIVNSVNVQQPKHAQQVFTGAPSSGGSVLSQLYKGLKKGSVPKTDLSAFTFDLISGTCYLVGGTGLLYDFAHQKTHKYPESKDFNVKPFKNAKSFMEFVNKENEQAFGKTSEVGKKKSEGVQTIIPESQFAKTGMKFARVAVLVAGVAGVFNGIALDLPLLALGEGITSLSAPIIETPIGTGIFGFGLALINLARVLDKDPEFKLNRDKFNAASKKEKFNLVMDNVTKTFKELGKSTKTIFKNVFGLVTPKYKESFGFFKNEMFSMKPSSIALQEQLTKDGKVILNKVHVNNPYLMHFAAFGLSVASVSLMVSNLLKMPKTEKASLGAYGFSNGIDNIALSKWGTETYMHAKTPSAKVTGGAFALAGASLLSGQAGIDKNWGRGLMWNGVGIILLGFGAQTGASVLKALKTKTINPVVVREWKIVAKNKILSSDLVKTIEEKLSAAFTSDAYNKNSEEVLDLIKNKLSEIKDAEGLEVRKISDTANLDKVKADMLEREKKFYS